MHDRQLSHSRSALNPAIKHEDSADRIRKCSASVDGIQRQRGR